MQRRAFLAGAAVAGLAGCSGTPVWAPDDVIASKTFRSSGPASLTLYTMRNTGSGNGAHTALLVDASQRVMFDPAGSFGHPTIPERNDVLFGFSPQVEQYYASYHARSSFYIISQKVLVAPEVAERALQLVMTNGAVGQANCTRATSAIIRQLPGFEGISQTWFPNNLSADFAGLAGVVTREYRENDSDDKSLAAQQVDMQIRAAQSQ